MSTQLILGQMFSNALDNILLRRCDDWVAKLQYLCRTFWSYLDEDPTVQVSYVETFIDLLQQEDIFGVARLVIPELRSESTFQLDNYYKEEILRQTQTLRVSFARPRLGAPALSEQNRLFRMERELYAEVEVYRAGLILYGSEALTSRQRMEARKRLTVGYEAVEGADEVVEQLAAVGRSKEGHGVGLNWKADEMSQAVSVYGKRKPGDEEKESWSKKKKSRLA